MMSTIAWKSKAAGENGRSASMMERFRTYIKTYGREITYSLLSTDPNVNLYELYKMKNER